MKKSIKIVLLITSIFLSIMIFCISYFFIVTSKYRLDENKLNLSTKNNVVFYDANNKLIESQAKNDNISILELNEHTKNAFIAIEDKRFYSHHGVDKKGVLRAVFKDITTFSFKEGASTITQQVIKNTHLTNEKTLNRKIIEMKLAIDLEKKYSKDQILEMYLNSIYFGHNCYGINSASQYYFSKDAKELTLNESAVLSAIVKSPLNYSPIKNYDKSMSRKNLVLKEMYNLKMITKQEYEDNIVNNITLINKSTQKNKDFNYLLENELDEIIEKNNIKSNNFTVYTTLNKEYQDILENSLFNYNVSDSASSIIIDNNGRILAYFSNIGEVNRQLGSIIKPVLVYAPAFDYNLIDETTFINDEISDFSGYSPKNYNNSYLGNITVKEAISKSSNVCAVKILNSLTVDKAKNKIKNLNLNLTENDNFLNIALGSTEKGATLRQITNAYLPFINNGYYLEAYTIDKIVDINGIVLYKKTKEKTKVFDEDTCFLINDCLNECVKSGTAKKLNKISQNLCSKTGTVGNENGNMDAYSIAYDKNIISSVWLGNENGTLMSNAVTGGNYPTLINSNILERIYAINGEPTFFDAPPSIKKINIDKLSFDEQKIELANEYTPERYKKEAFFKEKNVPKTFSKNFISPNIESYNLSVKNKRILISLCLKEYYNYKIIEESMGKSTCIYDSKIYGRKNKLEFELNNRESNFYVIPYTDKIEGKTIFLGKIKSPEIDPGDWWIE